MEYACIKSGTELTTVKSLDDLFETCIPYQSGYKDMKQSAFLKSTVSGDVFVGTKNEQMSFSARLKLFDKNELKCGSFMR